MEMTLQTSLVALGERGRRDVLLVFVEYVLPHADHSKRLRRILLRPMGPRLRYRFHSHGPANASKVASGWFWGGIGGGVPRSPEAGHVAGLVGHLVVRDHRAAVDGTEPVAKRLVVLDDRGQGLDGGVLCGGVVAEQDDVGVVVVGPLDHVVVVGVVPHHEERRLGAVSVEDVEHALRVLRGAVVEGEVDDPLAVVLVAPLRVRVGVAGHRAGPLAKDPEAVVDERGLRQTNDVSALEPIVDEVLERCGDQVRQYRDGNRKVVGYLVGQCMKASRGSGNPKLFNQLLTQKLEG